MTDDIPRRINAQGIEVVDTSDAAWATYVHEGRAQLAKAEAEGAEIRHQLELAKMEGLNAINSTKYDPDVLADARVLHNQDPAGPSVDELIETQVIPIREKYLEQFNSPAAPAPTKGGPNLATFHKLIGEKND